MQGCTSLWESQVLTWTTRTGVILTIWCSAALNVPLLTAQTTSEQEAASDSLCSTASFSTWQNTREAELSVVLVTGLVVLLLHNKLGRLADHSLKELWILAQSCRSATSNEPAASPDRRCRPDYQFVFDFRRSPTLHPTFFHSRPFLLFLSLLISPMFGLYPLILTVMTMG